MGCRGIPDKASTVISEHSGLAFSLVTPFDCSDILMKRSPCSSITEPIFLGNKLKSEYRKYNFNEKFHSISRWQYDLTYFFPKVSGFVLTKEIISEVNQIFNVWTYEYAFFDYCPTLSLGIVCWRNWNAEPCPKLMCTGGIMILSTSNMGSNFMFFVQVWESDVTAKVYSDKLFVSNEYYKRVAKIVTYFIMH